MGHWGCWGGGTGGRAIHFSPPAPLCQLVQFTAIPSEMPHSRLKDYQLLQSIVLESHADTKMFHSVTMNVVRCMYFGTLFLVEIQFTWKRQYHLGTDSEALSWASERVRAIDMLYTSRRPAPPVKWSGECNGESVRGSSNRFLFRRAESE